MKLLGWMHRKFRQNSGEALKDLAIGNSCNCLTGQPSLDEQQYYQKSNYGSRPPSRQTPRDSFLRKSFAGLEAIRADEEYFEEEPSDAFSELFHGLLAIGTLGSDPVSTEPATPTFPASLDNVTEKETDVTESDLKLINEELEKVLGADAEKDRCNDSSGRTSHVSTITLSGAETNGIGSAVCPLQGYLFGSPIELPGATTVSKKEHRTSLGELFQRSKLVEEKGERDGEKRGEKDGEKSLKKTLKKRMLRTSTNTATAAADSVSADTKLNKILQMFHRKVHPESSTTPKKSNKAHKNESKNNVAYDGGHYYRERTFPDEDIIMIPKRSISKDRLGRYKGHSNPPFTLSCTDSNENKECWIKTDSDYLVLEL